MGFGKKKRKVREAIQQWNCFGYFGYGQGRAVSQFGETEMSGKSACNDICSRAVSCRSRHHDLMNERFPKLSNLVESTARIASIRNLDVISEVVSAMNYALESELDEAIEVKNILGMFQIETMTDHYRCGQFENIQDGLNKSSPGTIASNNKPVKKAS